MGGAERFLLPPPLPRMHTERLAVPTTIWKGVRSLGPRHPLHASRRVQRPGCCQIRCGMPLVSCQGEGLLVLRGAASGETQLGTLTVPLRDGGPVERELAWPGSMWTVE